MAGKIMKNILRQFGYIDRKNNDNIVKEMDKVRVKGNRRRNKSEEWMDIIGKVIRACRVNENMIGDRKRIEFK